jgi:hypothetical protein
MEYILALVILLLLFFAISRIMRWRRAKTAAPYTPAVARIEGGGVKRGLTAPEAAVVLGRPLNVTLTLVIFEMLRKGLLLQVAAEPLTVALAEAFRTHGSGLSAQARGERRRLAAQAIKATLHLYEEPFLELIEAQPGVPVTELDFGMAIQPMVRYVAGRVGGYSLEETRAYYRLLIERAPREARSDGKLTFERQRIFDRNFGFVLLGDDFGSVLDQADYSYVPVWQRTSNVPRPTSDVEQTPSPALPLLQGKGAGHDATKLSFATWAAGVMEAMQGAVAEGDVKLTLGSETDAVTATLLNDVARATFYG